MMAARACGAMQDERSASFTTRESRGEMNIDGKTVQSSPGMAVSGEVKTGQRRVVEYLLSPNAQTKA